MVNNLLLLLFCACLILVGLGSLFFTKQIQAMAIRMTERGAKRTEVRFYAQAKKQFVYSKAYVGTVRVVGALCIAVAMFLFWAMRTVFPSVNQ